MAVATVPSVGELVPTARIVIMYDQGYKPNWVVGSTPGGQSGFIFEKYFKSPKCPHAVSAWTYFSQNTGNTEDDASLTVTCAAGRYYIYTISTHYLHTIYTLSTHYLQIIYTIYRLRRLDDPRGPQRRHDGA